MRRRVEVEEIGENDLVETAMCRQSGGRRVVSDWMETETRQEETRWTVVRMRLAMLPGSAAGGRSPMPEELK